MTRKIERTFVVSVPIERTWSAMTDPKELNEWYFPIVVDEDGTTSTEILGEERASEVVEFDPPHKLHTRTTMTGREGFGVKPGIREMTVVLQATASGTKIVITQSGFGESEDWDTDLANVTHGLEETMSDLVLYLETGVAFPRHHRGVKTFHGVNAKKVPAGLEIVEVQAGTFADSLGLQPGDLLVELDGAGVFGYAELGYFTKIHSPGDRAEAAWVRGGNLMRGSAEVGARIPVTA